MPFTRHYGRDSRTLRHHASLTKLSTVRIAWRIIVPCACGLTLGCGSPQNGADGRTDSPGDTTESDSESGRGVDLPSLCDNPQACSPTPARGIWIRSMEANQGVEVPIYADGAWLFQGERAGRFARVCGARGHWVDSLEAPLIAGRSTLIRVWWESSADFEAREIEARLTLYAPDGAITIHRQVSWVDRLPPCNPELTDTFHFVVPPNAIVPGVEAQLELFEVGHFSGEETSDAPRGHATTRQPLGVTDTDTSITAIIVPIQHNIAQTCRDAPTIGEGAQKLFKDRLFAIHPVQEVRLSVSDPLIYEHPLNESFLGLLAELAELHGEVSAGSHVYGVVHPCDGGPPGVQGLAIGVPDSPPDDEPWMRTSVGRWFEEDLEKTADTLVHEIGHGLGRRHVACNGNESDPDLHYPYTHATIGGWGWNLIENTMIPPDTKEYMSYCGPGWVSDWGWIQVVPHLEQRPENADRHPLIVGLISNRTGERYWLEADGPALSSRGHFRDRLEVSTTRGTYAVDGRVEALQDDDSIQVALVGPPDLDPTTIHEITQLIEHHRLPLLRAKSSSTHRKR